MTRARSGAGATVGPVAGAVASLFMVVSSLTINVTTVPAASPTTEAAPCVQGALIGLCLGRPATAQEEAAMIAVGRPAAEAELGLPDPSRCSATQLCFQVSNPSLAMVGTNAGTFSGDMFCKTPCGGSPCRVFLFQDASGWHYVNARCAGNTGFMPGTGDEVFVSSCANVRNAPALSAPVVVCLKAGSPVDVDSAPVYADGHIWWHLACRGWMAHDFLVAPLKGPYPARLSPTFSPAVTLTPDHGPPTTLVTFVGQCFPPNEFIGVYIDNSSGPAFMGTPGPTSDANGRGFYQFSIPFYGPQQVRICGDTGYQGNHNQYPAKACVTFTIEASQPPPPFTPAASSAVPTPSEQPVPPTATSATTTTGASPIAAPVITQAAAKSPSLKDSVLWVIGIVVVVIAAAGGILAYRRRS